MPLDNWKSGGRKKNKSCARKRRSPPNDPDSENVELVHCSKG